jgi:hypothetical protein
MKAGHTRREFLTAASISIAAIVIYRRDALAGPVPAHPDPRPGITGEHVLKADQLGGKKPLIELFDSIRKIPEVVDGIHCNCGCTNPPEFRSLLSCYEKNGMARDCAICQGQGRLAVRLHTEGKTLDQIRAAIDAKFA